MADWYKMPPSWSMTESEYDANIRGMNIVFGAVLGFVLAGTEGLPADDFAIVLLLSASVVITILYLAHSPYRLFYGMTAALVIYLLPMIQEEILGINRIPKLQPTLAVWALMVVIVELIPRRDKRQKPNSKDNKKQENDT